MVKKTPQNTSSLDGSVVQRVNFLIGFSIDFPKIKPVALK